MICVSMYVCEREEHSGQFCERPSHQIYKPACWAEQTQDEVNLCHIKYLTETCIEPSKPSFEHRPQQAIGNYNYTQNKEIWH